MAKDLGYIKFFVADTNGKARINGAFVDVADREYFKDAMNGTNSISDPLISKTTKALEINIAVPIKNPNNEITGVLVGSIDGNGLSDMTNKVTFGKSGKAFMISGEGTTIADYNQDNVMNMENVSQEAKTDTALAQLAAIQDKMAAGQNGTGQYTYKGVTKYMGYHSVDGTDWSIGVTAPKTEIFAAATVLAWLILLASFIFLALSIFAAYIIARTISNPIKAAVLNAEVLAKGDFTMKVPDEFIKRKDELGTLASAFKSLGETLNSALLNINEASEQVASGSKQVSDSSMALSQGATEQASSIEELTASIEEISSQTKQNASNAKEANNFAVLTKENANKGHGRLPLYVYCINKTKKQA